MSISKKSVVFKTNKKKKTNKDFSFDGYSIYAHIYSFKNPKCNKLYICQYITVLKKNKQKCSPEEHKIH